ncbi:unnamed protein product [Soboliphyme baturini]|uniref:Immediate early response 3-interacting protein 1 n=1 Tax=Soboliphyme baturini TaxID=241478 RepID=A0A183IP86_9BILA|nr:unnamed protein product [Soboliphyme baturini]
MAVTLYTLLESILLFINALAILNQERFLKRSKSKLGVFQRVLKFIVGKSYLSCLDH